MMVYLEPWTDDQTGYTETIKELFIRSPRYNHSELSEDVKALKGALSYVKTARKGWCLHKSYAFKIRFMSKLKEIHMRRKKIKRISKYNISELINYSIDLLNAITFDEISVKKGILLTNLLDKTVKQVELLAMHNENKALLEGGN
jgi:hypothetical protein